jgi:hypothetical protein
VNSKVRKQDFYAGWIGKIQHSGTSKASCVKLVRPLYQSYYHSFKRSDNNFGDDRVQ